MESLEGVVAETRILGKESETLMGAAGSKPDGNRNGSLDDERKEDDGSSYAAAAVLDEKPVFVEPTPHRDCGIVKQGKGKRGVENLSGVVNGGDSVSVNGSVVVREEANGSCDGVGGEEKVKDMEDSCVDDGESRAGERDRVDGGAGDGEGVENGGRLEDGEHEFAVGDFVWGKIKSHPWWPGQVYDPKDASEFAVKHRQEGRLLVAFFGDGSCSWCLPSKLVPFVENFAEMSMGSTSKSFVNAVEQATNEIGRLVEAQMLCECVPEERKDGLARPEVKNAGVKAGVLVPEVDVRKLAVPAYEPAELVAKLNQFATGVLVGNALEVAVLRSWISAFSRYKDGHQLPLYPEPVFVEGLEDKKTDVTAAEHDSSLPLEVPVHGPQDDEWISSPRAGAAAKAQGSSGDIIYQRRKQKSVAEIMKKTNVEPENSSKRMVKQEKDNGNSAISEKKKKKRNDGEAKRESGQPASASGKKRKLEAIESPQRSAEGDLGDVGGMHEGSSPGKPKKIGVAAAASDSASSDAKEELDKASTPRERKRSKYLSPPYTDLSWKMAVPSSKVKMELGIESEKPTKRIRSKSVAEISEALPVSGSVDKEAKENPPVGKLETTSQAAENDGNLTFPVADVDMPVDKLLANIQSAAIDPMYLSKEGSLEMVWSFISALRSSTYSQGSNYKVFHKCRTGKKRKSLASDLANQEKDLSTSKKAKLVDVENPKAMKAEGKSGQTPKSSASKTGAVKVEGFVSPCLTLTFTPGFPLPSTEDIMNLYCEFGSLKEIHVEKESHSIRIVFLSDYDAESAFKSSLTQSPFGLENVNYKLQRSSAGSKPRGSRPKALRPDNDVLDTPDPSHPSAEDDFMSVVKSATQKLGIMTAILENYHPKFSAEDKSSLKDEMKSLLEKVETSSEKVRVLAEKTSLYRH